MKKTSLFILIASVIMLFASCQSNTNSKETKDTESNNTSEQQSEDKAAAAQTENKQKEYAVKAGLSDNFVAFWEDFQQKVIAGDKEGVFALCTAQGKKHIEPVWESMVDERMKEEIKNCTAAHFPRVTNDRVIFSYTKNPNNQGAGTSLGFIFDKIEGQWFLVSPHIAG